MSRRLERRYWEENVSVENETKKVHQVYCGNELGVNRWLKKNPDIEVVDFKMSMNEEGELIAVIYKIELEEAK